MTNAIGDAGQFLIQTLLFLATFAFLMRFIVQAVRADFYNPITQGIVKLTDPVLGPIRRLLPPMGGLDLASLLLALALQILLVILLAPVGVTEAILLGAFQLLMLVLDIYFWALIILVILSWVAPTSHHPGAVLVHQITEPLLAPFRRVIPPAGGLDFSVLVAFLVLMVIREYLLPGLAVELFGGMQALPG